MYKRQVSGAVVLLTEVVKVEVNSFEVPEVCGKSPASQASAMSWNAVIHRKQQHSDLVLLCSTDATSSTQRLVLNLSPGRSQFTHTAL